MRLRILTVVWGEDFVQRLVNLTFRSLLARGNVPDLVRQHDVTYDLYAPFEDIERIKAAPIFAEFARMIEMRFHPFSLADIDAKNAMSHWVVWNWAAAAAGKDDVFVILVAPDHVFCSGALMRWAELLNRGHLAIFSPGVQVSIETFEQETAERFPGYGPLDLPLPGLRELMFRHLHPIKITMFRTSPRSIGHPEWHLRAIPGQGVVQKILASHAVAFHPGRIKLSDNFSPTEQFERIAFEPSWFLGVEPLLKYLGLYLRRGAMDDTTLSYYGVWGDRFTSAVNILESGVTHHYAIGPAISEDAERRQRRGAEFFVGQMHASRSIVRVWRTLRDAGLYQAAQWLAAAHIFARLRRRLPIKAPLTLFVPSDNVLARLCPSTMTQLLAGGGEELMSVLLHHVAPGRIRLEPGDWLAESSNGTIGTASGRRFATGSQGMARIVRGPICIDDINIYVIDQLLVSLPLCQPAASDVLGTIHRTFDHSRRRVARKMKDVVLTMLQSNQHLLMRALKLREAVWTRWQVTKHKFARPLQWRGPMRHQSAAPVCDLDAIMLYRRAMAARGLYAIKDIYAFYSANVLDGSSIAAAPAARLAKIPDASFEEVSTWLEEAVRRSPDFAEAWLELGFLRKEAGKEGGAIDAFDRAQSAMPAFDQNLGQPHLRAIAGTERAQLLAQRGQSEAALAQLDAMLEQRWLPWTFYLCRARLLLACARPREALAAFEQCLTWTNIEPRFPALPGRIEELEQWLGR
jgi:uncharacterized surface protein with fasciclin (FAS1) repeats